MNQFRRFPRSTRRPAAVVALAALIPTLAACDLGNDAHLDDVVIVHESADVDSSVDGGSGVAGARTARSASPGLGQIELTEGSVPERLESGAAPVLHIRDEWADERPIDEYGTTQWESMEDFMFYVLVELDQYWSSVFAENELTEPWVNYWFPAPGEWGYSACTDQSGQPSLIDDRSLFYCPASENIVVSQQVAYDIWSGAMVGPDGQQAGGMIGDFAVAMVIAHEFGHHIQDELGLLGTFDTPTIEQHADCLAGVWTAAAEGIGILDPGDVEEGMTAAWLVGDSAFDAADHHGTSDERVAAFVAGYAGAAPSACDGFIPAGLA